MQNDADAESLLDGSESLPDDSEVEDDEVCDDDDDDDLFEYAAE